MMIKQLRDAYAEQEIVEQIDDIAWGWVKELGREDPR
jgi:hypothetical protein